MCSSRLGNKNSVKHGEHGTQLYKKWKSMRGRVQSNPHYIASNIQCCVEWDNYMIFKTWAESNGFSSELSLDRIDTYDGYKPSNCRWANNTTQSSNICIKCNNTSGFSGVSFNKQKQMYIAQVQFEGKKTYLGQFKKDIDAAQAFDKFIIDNSLPHTLNFGGHYAKN